MRWPSRLARRLRHDRRGSAVIEFAIAAPVLLVMLLGIWDMGHMAYLTAILHGAVQQVARNDSLEGADTTKADTYVSNIVRTVAPGATVAGKRMSYYDFTDIKRAEAWNDKDGDGKCDNSETYTDENRNGQWDADIGSSTNGGANDVVLYTVTVTYTPVFYIPFMSSGNKPRTLTASVVHKNQPFALQAKYGTTAGVCK